MRPPAYPKMTGIPFKPRPTFAGPCSCRPPKKLAVYKTAENKSSMMKQCCQRGHHKTPYPLQSVHDNNPVEVGFAPQPARPKLPRRPYRIAPLLVHQFE